MNKLQIINEGSLKQAVMLGRFGGRRGREWKLL